MQGIHLPPRYFAVQQGVAAKAEESKNFLQTELLVHRRYLIETPTEWKVFILGTLTLF